MVSIIKTFATLLNGNEPRYDGVLKDFAGTLYYLGGEKTYNVLRGAHESIASINLPLPSLSTVQRHRPIYDSDISLANFLQEADIFTIALDGMLLKRGSCIEANGNILGMKQRKNVRDFENKEEMNSFIHGTEFVSQIGEVILRSKNGYKHYLSTYEDSPDLNQILEKSRSCWKCSTSEKKCEIVCEHGSPVVITADCDSKLFKALKNLHNRNEGVCFAPDVSHILKNIRNAMLNFFCIMDGFVFNIPAMLLPYFHLESTGFRSVVTNAEALLCRDRHKVSIMLQLCASHQLLKSYDETVLSILPDPYYQHKQFQSQIDMVTVFHTQLYFISKSKLYSLANKKIPSYKFLLNGVQNAVAIGRKELIIIRDKQVEYIKYYPRKKPDKCLLITSDVEISKLDADQSNIVIVQDNRISVFKYEDTKDGKKSQICWTHDLKERILQVKIFGEKLHVFVFSTTNEYKVYSTTLTRAAFRSSCTLNAAQELRSFSPSTNGYFLGGDGLFFFDLSSNQLKVLCRQEKLQNG